MFIMKNKQTNSNDNKKQIFGVSPFLRDKTRLKQNLNGEK